MRKQELAQAGLERESVDAVAGGVHEHRARTVHDVAGGELAAARLETIPHRAAPFGGDARQDREDGPDVDVRVDVRRAVERIEIHYVAPHRLAGWNRDDVLVLLRGQHRELPGLAQDPVDRVARELVQLLDLLAVHVLGPGVTQDVHQPGAHDLAVDGLGGERDVREQVGEFTLGSRVLALHLEQMLRQGEGLAGHGG